MNVEQTVILAAGQGTRLSNGNGRPKALLNVNGQPLVDHALNQARVAGCSRAIVVIGYRAELLRSHLGGHNGGLQIDVVYNPAFAEPNGGSLLAAAPYVDGPFFLQMADHVFGRPVLRDLLAPGLLESREARLLVDPAPTWMDERDATKVLGRRGVAAAIGKDITPWNLVDAGMFLLDPAVFAALDEVADREPPSVTAAMGLLAARGRLKLVALAETLWVDVDTPRDLAAAVELFGAGAAGVDPGAGADAGAAGS